MKFSIKFRDLNCLRLFCRVFLKNFWEKVYLARASAGDETNPQNIQNHSVCKELKEFSGLHEK